MEQFENILVTASPGHLELATLRAAAELATADDARLTVIDVMDPGFRMRRMTLVEGRVVDVQAEILRHRKERLRSLVDSAGAHEDTDVTVLVGEPFIEVIRHVLEYGNDLVIVGSHDVPKWESPEFGSDVMHLLRKCPAPVWVMYPPRDRTLEILALVDPDPDDPVRDSLNDLVLDLAASLARREHAQLHIGHAWELSGEATLRSSPYVGLSGEMVDVMVDTVRNVHREDLDLLLARHDIEELAATVHLVEGEAGIVLPRLAETLDVGLIVMGTVARTGLSGFIVGNTAETILRSVRCSVLAVKPEGFETPVKRAKDKRERQ